MCKRVYLDLCLFQEIINQLFSEIALFNILQSATISNIYIEQKNVQKHFLLYRHSFGEMINQLFLETLV